MTKSSHRKVSSKAASADRKLMTFESITGRVLVDTNVLICATLATDSVIVTENDNDFLNIKGITPINPFA